MRRFVGFGFGPIQAGLVLYEAQASRAFDDYVIAEVDGRLVDAVRSAGGAVTVNVAAADGIHQHPARHAPRRRAEQRLGDFVRQSAHVPDVKHHLATPLGRVDVRDQRTEHGVRLRNQL